MPYPSIAVVLGRILTVALLLAGNLSRIITAVGFSLGAADEILPLQETAKAIVYPRKRMRCKSAYHADSGKCASRAYF
jgi:hypothetical protein